MITGNNVYTGAKSVPEENGIDHATIVISGSSVSSANLLTVKKAKWII